MLLLLSCTTAASPSDPPVLPPDPPAPPAPAPPAPPPIVDRLLPFDDDRVALTRAYLSEHAGLDQPDITITPRVIVLHWTAGATADSAWNTFAASRLAGRGDLARGGPLNVSAHYLVDRDGTIYRLMPDTQMARHTIGLNHVAIGIENVGGGEQWPLTPAQVDADAALVRWLAGTYPTITHLIGHLEARAFEGHPYFHESDPKYRTSKPDPGAPFMAAVRAKVADLRLSGPPG